MGKIKNDIEFSSTAQKEFKELEKGLRKVSQRLIAEEKPATDTLLSLTKKAI